MNGRGAAGWFARSLAAAIVAATVLAGCSNDSTVDAAANDREFMAWYAGVGDEIQADPNYHRMPIDTSEQEFEFGAKLHQAYRGVISHADFAQWANMTYPGHAYEVDFITGRLPGQ